MNAHHTLFSLDYTGTLRIVCAQRVLVPSTSTEGSACPHSRARQDRRLLRFLPLATATQCVQPCRAARRGNTRYAYASGCSALVK
jgi:hypothetical protein